MNCLRRLTADGLFVPKLAITLRRYSWPQLRSDIAAGIVVGLVALPLAMAFAIASGVPPERGLYTAIVAGFLISALGGSRVQIGGPTGAFVVIVGGIVARYGYDGLVLATLMAGVLLIAMGLGRLGALVKFIPYPVITGFTSGIAVVIFSSQIKDFFGLHMNGVPLDFVDKWKAYVQAMPTLTPAALGISLFTVALIFAWPKRWKRIPGPIVALVVVTAIASLFHLPVETIGSRFGGIPRGLAVPHWPRFSISQAKALFPSALTVAALGAIESLLSAVVADGMIGGRHRSNQELLAQGLANIASPLFGGIPATGAIARTATNIKNGGRTPIAGMVHAVVLLFVLIVFGPLANRIPLAALTGVLVVVCYHMSEWHSFRFILSGPGSDKIVLLATFLLTVFVDLVVAVEVGMVLAAFLFMKNMAEITQVKALGQQIGNGEAGDPTRQLVVPPNVEVFSIRGAFFFAAVHKLMELDRVVARAPRALVIDMEDVLHMDASGLHVLDQIHRECRSRGIRFIVSGIHSQPYAVVDQADKIEVWGRQNIQPNLTATLAEIDRPLIPTAA